jgi:hypothetical protein
MGLEKTVFHHLDIQVTKVKTQSPNSGTSLDQHHQERGHHSVGGVFRAKRSGFKKAVELGNLKSPGEGRW